MKKPLIIFLIAAVFVACVLFLLYNTGAIDPYGHKLRLANKYMQNSNYEEAILEYKNAIDISPKDPEPYEGLIEAYVLADNDDTVTGVAETFKAYAEATGSGDDAALVSAMLLNIHKLEVSKAQQLLRAVMAVSSNTQLAQVLAQLGDRSEGGEAPMPDVVEKQPTATESSVNRGSMPPDLDEQLQLIINSRSVWKKDETFYPFSYTVTDLDHNGRLEIIAAAIQGTAHLTEAYYYEVNKAHTGLDEYTVSDSPDIMQDSLTCYKKGDRYYYNINTALRGGAGYYYYDNSLFSLTDGMIKLEPFAAKSDEYDHSTGQQNITCYRLKGSDKTQISEDEYENLINDPFGTGEKGTEVALKWINIVEDTLQETDLKACAETFFGN